MTAKKSASKTSREQLIDRYMTDVLEKEAFPASIYKFCKEHNFREEEFYAHFGSFDGLKRGIWSSFFQATTDLLDKNKEYESFSNKDKLLTFYFSFFELLALNRSYVLFSLSGKQSLLRNLHQLRGLRKRFKGFAGALIADGNSGKSLKITERNPAVFSEAAWLQLLFLLRFWIEDVSPGFEKTDIAIEKSVQTAFDLFENTPLDSILDFGKFLFKEHMA